MSCTSGWTLACTRFAPLRSNRVVNTPEKLAEARRRALEMMAAFNAGEINLDLALDAIVEIWTGQADRIVRIGNEKHTPEIQS